MGSNVSCKVERDNAFEVTHVVSIVLAKGDLRQPLLTNAAEHLGHNFQRWRAKYLKNMPIETMRKKGKIVIRSGGPYYEVRNVLHKRGFRFRVFDKRFAGTPHLVFVSRKLMIYTVTCEIAHPPDTPTSRMGWWEKQHRMDADELILIRRGMAIQGWRCEVICNCQQGNEEMLLKRLADVIGE